MEIFIDPNDKTFLTQLYPKIEGPFERDTTVKHGKPILGKWREP